MTTHDRLGDLFAPVLQGDQHIAQLFSLHKDLEERLPRDAQRDAHSTEVASQGR